MRYGPTSCRVSKIPLRPYVKSAPVTMNYKEECPLLMEMKRTVRTLDMIQAQREMDEGTWNPKFYVEYGILVSQQIEQKKLKTVNCHDQPVQTKSSCEDKSRDECVSPRLSEPLEEDWVML